jgi:hypothetical protein
VLLRLHVSAGVKLLDMGASSKKVEIIKSNLHLLLRVNVCRCVCMA